MTRMQHSIGLRLRNEKNEGSFAQSNHRLELTVSLDAKRFMILRMAERSLVTGERWNNGGQFAVLYHAKNRGLFPVAPVNRTKCII